MSRPASRAGSFLDPLSDAEALAAAQAAGQPQTSQDSSPAAAADAAASTDAADKAADALGNEQLVWEMLYNPDYSLPTTDAVAAWHRAMGKEPEEEEVSKAHVVAACLHLWQTAPVLVNQPVLLHRPAG